MQLTQILYILIAGLPYIAILGYLLFGKNTNKFPFSTVLLGLMGIVLAVLFGGIFAVLIIVNFPQTSSTLTNSYLYGVWALMMLIAMLIGEGFRYMILRPEKNADEKSELSGLAFGIGFSLGEFAFFVGSSVFTENPMALDGAIIVAVDIIIQLVLSVAAYQLIKQNNFGFIAISGLYFVSLIAMLVLNNSTILNIGFKALLFIVSFILLYTFTPSKTQYKTKGGDA